MVAGGALQAALGGSLGSVFAGAVLPIVAVAAVGYLVDRRLDVDAGPLNTVTVYVLVPALVVHSLATTTLTAETLARLAVGTAVFQLALLGLAEGVGRAAGEEEPILGAFVLTASLSNGGNYGIPLATFAFGAAGRSTAVVFLTVQALIVYTVGVYVAARSGGSRGRAGIRTVLGIPLVYAVVVALVARWLDVVPPVDSTTMQTLELVGNAAIPVMLLLLGMQLRGAGGATLSRTVAPSAIKLLVAPAVGLALALALGFGDDAVARAFVLECAMPSAVASLVLVTEFGGSDGDVAPTQYASAVILVTTLLSVPLLTLLIALLRSGVLV